MTDHNARIIEEFRANHGRVGGHFEGRPLLLLTHTGRRSGTRRTNPLAYLRHDDRVFVFASKGGAPTDPDWVHNLRENPAVTVEIGDETFDAVAVEITGPERDEIFALQAERWPAFRGYEAAGTRTIPVVELVQET